MEARIRVLVAKPGPDGRDRGAKLIARVLSESGMEVCHTGLRQTPEMIATTVLQEDVQMIGLSILSGLRTAVVPCLTRLLHDRGMDDVIVRGGTVRDADVNSLRNTGVPEGFQHEASLDSIVQFIRDHVTSPDARVET